MTQHAPRIFAIPAQAGIHAAAAQALKILALRFETSGAMSRPVLQWVPAFAGMKRKQGQAA